LQPAKVVRQKEGMSPIRFAKIWFTLICYERKTLFLH
jgi:hypothetical protein